MEQRVMAVKSIDRGAGPFRVTERRCPHAIIHRGILMETFKEYKNGVQH
jgi:hypothetical protein